MEALWNTVGLIGVVIILATYTLLQVDRLKTEDIRYSIFNLIGSLLILASLVFGEWNFPSVIIEVFWAVISVYGIIKNFRQRRLQRAPIGAALKPAPTGD